MPFIVIDGPDGTGKTTVAEALASRLRGYVAEQREIDSSYPFTGVTSTREPHTKRVREWLSDSSVSARELLIVFAHDRDLHLREVVEPALARGEIVVCDRYTYSTVAYQTLHNPPELVEALVSHVRKPDLTVMLTCPVEVAMARIVARGLPPDRYDQRADLQARVSETYAACAAKDPACVVVDASGTPEDVLETVLFVVRQYLLTYTEVMVTLAPFVGERNSPELREHVTKSLYDRMRRRRIGGRLEKGQT